MNPDTTGLRRARIGVFGGFATSGFVMGAWAAALPSVDARLDLGEARLGTTLLLIQTVGLATMFLAGRLADRITTRRLLQWTGPLAQLVLLAPALAPSYEALLACAAPTASASASSKSASTPPSNSNATVGPSSPASSWNSAAPSPEPSPPWASPRPRQPVHAHGRRPRLHRGSPSSPARCCRRRTAPTTSGADLPARIGVLVLAAMFGLGSPATSSNQGDRLGQHPRRRVPNRTRPAPPSHRSPAP